MISMCLFGVSGVVYELFGFRIDRRFTFFCGDVARIGARVVVGSFIVFFFFS